MMMTGFPVSDKRRIEILHDCDGTGASGADHDPVGLHEIVHGGSLLEEFGVGDDVKVELGPAGNDVPDLVGGPDRHGALIDDHLIPFIALAITSAVERT